MLELWDGDWEEWQASQLLTRTYTNQTTSCLVHSCSTFGAQTSHGQTRTHKIHHGMDLGEATTFPLIVFYVLGHEANTQMSFCPGTPKLGVSKFPKLGLPQLWRPTTSFQNLQLRWGLQQSCSPLQELFKGMSHATCTQINWGNSQVLVVGSQIGNLTPDLSFGHNLCF
jgi:hypothetical protein